ncbi:N-acetylmuramoyl-L-alanine amidase [Streptomyces sp. NPDC003860]
MAVPLTANRFRDALDAAGVDVVEVGPWRTHSRNHKGPWGPVHGVMIHHTVTKAPTNAVDLCRRGHSALPGPLCHGVVTKDARVHLVGYGRTNHAGLGDDDVLSAVIAEKPLPADNETNTDGNRHFYGFECENQGDGKDPWPEAQVEAVARAAAAICRAHGWSAASVIGHSEWQKGKIDPYGPIGKKDGPALTMAKIRARVAELLNGTAPTKPTKPAPPVVDLSLLMAAARRDPLKPGTPVSYAGARIVESALAAERLLDWSLVDGHFGSSTVTAYARWQRRCGYTGAAADGIPGAKSLALLGKQHGFTVTP